MGSSGNQRMIVCHSMTAGWMVGTLRAGWELTPYLRYLNLFELIALIGSGNAETCSRSTAPTPSQRPWTTLWNFHNIYLTHYSFHCRTLEVHLTLFSKFNKPRALHGEQRLNKLYHEVCKAKVNITSGCDNHFKPHYQMKYSGLIFVFSSF